MSYLNIAALAGLAVALAALNAAIRADRYSDAREAYAIFAGLGLVAAVVFSVIGLAVTR